MVQEKAIVIGSGVAGIAVAIRLQLLGYAVHIFEANHYIGGKMSAFEIKGFRFDKGPSLFTLPELVDDLFVAADKNPRDYFSYEKLEKACRYHFSDGTILDGFCDPEKLAAEITQKTKDSEKAVLRHLKNCKEINDFASPLILEQSVEKAKRFKKLNPFKALKMLSKLQLNKSMHDVHAKRFKDSKTQRVFDRFATYNGSDPYRAPGILSLIADLEHGSGAYYPKGGIYSIAKALHKLAKEIGVVFHLGAAVEEIIHESGKAVAIKSKGQEHQAGIIVSNADVRSTYQHLLGNLSTNKNLFKKELSTSAMVFYWGINRQFPELDLHNIFFSDDYKKEFQELERGNLLVDNLSIYVNISAKKTPSDAPGNSENWFVMINLPANTEKDWRKETAKIKKSVIQKLENILGKEIEQHIICEEILDPHLLEKNTSSWQGALYGAASNEMLSAFTRHSNLSPLENLYFCGGSVHPGGGIPLCLHSAKIVADIVANKKAQKNA